MTHVATILSNQGFVQKFLALPSLNEGKRFHQFRNQKFAFFLIGIVQNFQGFVHIRRWSHADQRHQPPDRAAHVRQLPKRRPVFRGCHNETGRALTVLRSGRCRKSPGTSRTVHRRNRLRGFKVQLYISFCNNSVLNFCYSTLSATLNSTAAATFNDFVAPFLPKNMADKSISNVLKLMVVGIGLLCTAMVYVVEHLGGLLSLQLSFNAITLGPTLGLFLFGLLVPSGTKKVRSVAIKQTNAIK